MAAEAEASREARAKVIAAEGEQKASRQLKEAADVIAESPIALQLRYLQTLTHISAEKNSTIIFPIPSQSSIEEGELSIMLTVVSFCLVELLSLVKRWSQAQAFIYQRDSFDFVLMRSIHRIVVVLHCTHVSVIR